MTAPAGQPRLPAGSPLQCFHCGKAPEFQVGPDMRACGPHLADVLSRYFDTAWDGWIPCAVAPLSLGAIR